MLQRQLLLSTICKNASPSFHGINWYQGFELKQGYCSTQAKIIWCCIFGLGDCMGWTHKWCLSHSWPCSESLCCTFRDTPMLASFPIVMEDSPLRFITEFYLGLSCREIFVPVFLCVVSLFFLNKPLSKKCLVEFPGSLGIHLLCIYCVCWAKPEYKY